MGRGPDRRARRITDVPIIVYHRTGCELCSRIELHTHTRDEWATLTRLAPNAQKEPPSARRGGRGRTAPGVRTRGSGKGAGGSSSGRPSPR
jgi:hypothetical protein